jgi:hypothetical protein
LRALRNLIPEADLILETTPPLGKKGGASNAKRWLDYFRQLAAKRKTRTSAQREIADRYSFILWAHLLHNPSLLKV